MGLNIHDKKRNESLIGQRFGKLIVIRQIESYVNKASKSTSYRARFECLCDCGKIKNADGTKLRKGTIKKCSDCAYKSRPQSTERYTNLERLFNLSILRRVKDKNIDCDITIEDFENIISQNCHYCGAEPRIISHLNSNRIVERGELRANGIDRLDNSKGYILSNCVPCCPQCNSMKMDYTEEEFYNKIKMIYNKWIQQRDLIMKK